jgi:hypothetical protein
MQRLFFMRKYTLIWELQRKFGIHQGLESMNWAMKRMGISFVKFVSNPMCQVEVWGVLIVCVKFGVVCTNGQLLSLWV